jgi:hypothetical protein
MEAKGVLSNPPPLLEDLLAFHTTSPPTPGSHEPGSPYPDELA